VRGLTPHNVRLEAAASDLGPAVVFYQVADASVNSLSAAGSPQAESLLRFVNSWDALLTPSRVLTPSAVFLKLEGAASDGITIDGGSISKARTALAYGPGGIERAVRLRT